MRSRSSRLLASFAVVALVACTLLVEWHRATVTHERCAEHGEEIHVDRHGGDGVAQAQTPADDEGRRIGSSPREAPHGDDHCQLLATSHETTTPAAELPAAHLTPDIDDLPAAIIAAPAPTLALYRLAPKTSPPV